MKSARFCLLLVSLLLMGSSVRAQESREVDRVVPLAKDGRVSIDTYKGGIDIETWDKGEVEIHVKIEADGWGRYEEEKVKDTEIVIDASSGSVRIRTDYDRLKRRGNSFWDLFDGGSGNLPLVYYTIKMPATAKLHIKDYKSDTRVSNLRAGMEMNTYKGEVEIRSLSGGLDFETYKGECRVEFSNLTDRSQFETYKGEIRISLPSNAGFSLDADVGRRGDFDSDFQFASSVSSRYRRDYWYRGDVNGGGPVLRLRTDKGAFRLLKH